MLCRCGDECGCSAKIIKVISERRVDWSCKAALRQADGCINLNYFTPLKFYDDISLNAACGIMVSKVQVHICFSLILFHSSMTIAPPTIELNHLFTAFGKKTIVDDLNLTSKSSLLEHHGAGKITTITIMTVMIL